jgi:hypothetical protein
VRTYSASGTCNDGSCNYSPIDTACNTPPAPTCSGGVLRTYTAAGTCSNASCSYPSTNTTCQFGCAASGTACAGDPCATMSCNSPPASTCADASTVRIYSPSGTCSNGVCSYTSTTSNCPMGCANGACRPCNSTTCANGCCNINGACLDNETFCRGTGGGSCGSGCGSGYCDNCFNRRWTCVSGSCECGGFLEARSLIPECPIEP